MIEHCFLCAPDAELVYSQAGKVFALAGLGPIGPGYSVLSVNEHIRCVADLPHELRRQLVAFAEHHRNLLSKRFDSCVITEHGRMPLCMEESGLAETHCYHAHLLAFPGVPPIDALAVPHFGGSERFDSLALALESARRRHGEYFLISSRPDRALVFRQPYKLIPQFARGLAAAAVGDPGLTDWRIRPEREKAAQIAALLRGYVESSTRLVGASDGA